MAFIRFSLFFMLPMTETAVWLISSSRVSRLSTVEIPFLPQEVHRRLHFIVIGNGAFQLPSGSPVGTFPTPLFQIPE